MPHLKPTDFDVAKHSDYFVSKDTSERAARRCDDTVDKKQVNPCVLKHLFLEGVEQPNALSDALLMSHFQRFAADAAKKKTALCAVFANCASRGFDYWNKDIVKITNPRAIPGPLRFDCLVKETVQEKRFYWHDSRLSVTISVESKWLEKTESLPQMSVCHWKGVNSTMTRHSDYFIEGPKGFSVIHLSP